MDQQAEFKSGFVSIVGRPNVGKSTLTNQLVQNKVAIMSDKPQTTRNAIRGILNLENAQVVFIDTPGLHKPKTLLGERLNSTVRRTFSEVDAIIFVLDGSEPFRGGDEFIARELGELSTPILCVINKADRSKPDELLDKIEQAKRLGQWRDVLTTSATLGTGLRDLLNSVVELLPPGPQYYAPDAISDQPELLVVAELIREKIIRVTREEVPHSVAVVVEEIQPREGADLTDISADILTMTRSNRQSR